MWRLGNLTSPASEIRYPLPGHDNPEANAVEDQEVRRILRVGTHDRANQDGTGKGRLLVD